MATELASPQELDGQIDSQMEAERQVRFGATRFRGLLRFIGEDPHRDGLKDTPERAAKAMLEMTCGYADDPSKILSKVFEESCDEMVVIADIPFFSLCEHHLLPFVGAATIAYIPANGRIVGLSKIPRLLHCFAKRLQVQERLTQQVTDSIMKHLKAAGAGCIITAHHLCMSMRGSKCRGTMTTSSLQGVFRTDASARAEFLRLGVPRLPVF